MRRERVGGSLVLKSRANGKELPQRNSLQRENICSHPNQHRELILCTQWVAGNISNLSRDISQIGNRRSSKSLINMTKGQKKNKESSIFHQIKTRRLKNRIRRGATQTPEDRRLIHLRIILEAKNALSISTIESLLKSMQLKAKWEPRIE